MKNSKLVKIVLIMIISLLIVIVARNSFAATDLTDTLTGNSTGNNITPLTGNNTINDTTNNTSLNNKTNNVVLTTNNTSNYNNTSLPKTGIEDSVPGVLLVVVLGISAVYAYKKMQDYKNI